MYSGNVNPIVGIDMNIKLTKKIALLASLGNFIWGEILLIIHWVCLFEGSKTEKACTKKNG